MKRGLIVAAVLVGLMAWMGTPSLLAGEPGHEHGDHTHTHGSGDAPALGQMGPPPVGPEHQRLLEFVGTWKIEHLLWSQPGAEPLLSTGTEIITPALDGRAIISNVETTGSIGKFKGYGVATWNPAKRKYETHWLDIFSQNGMEVSWGTFDPKTNTWQWTAETMGMDGRMMKTRAVDTILSKDRRTMEYYVPTPDGKEFKMMAITATRVK